MKVIEFLTENLGTAVVLCAVIALVTFLVIKLVKDKKEGKSSCSCGCSACPMSKECQGKNK